MKLILVFSMLVVGCRALWAAETPVPVYSVCQVLRQLASPNKKMISVRGAVISGGHGEFLLGRCGSRLKVGGFTWPDVICLAAADRAENGFATDANAYARIREAVRRARRSSGDELLMTFVGVLDTEDLETLTVQIRLDEPVGIGFGSQNVAPAQLFVKTVRDLQVVKRPERKQGTSKNFSGALGRLHAMPPQSPDDTCTIRVTATDPFGKPLRDYTLELRTRDGTLIRPGPGSRSFIEVPFGEYTLIAITGCCRTQRNLIVNAPSMWVRLGVPVRYGDSAQPGGDLAVEGLIRGTPRLSGERWVRVRGIFLDATREAEIGPDGRFSIAGLDMGSYAVEVFVGAKRLYSQTIEIDPRSPITDLVIELGKGEPQ